MTEREEWLEVHEPGLVLRLRLWRTALRLLGAPRGPDPPRAPPRLKALCALVALDATLCAWGAGFLMAGATLGLVPLLCGVFGFGMDAGEILHIRERGRR